MDQFIKYSGTEKTFELVHRNEKSSRPMPPHTHNASEIYLALSPIENVLLGTNVISIPKNTLILFPSYCVHQLSAKTNTVYHRYILTINSSWIDTTLEENKTYSYLKNTDNPIVVPMDDISLKLLIESFEDLIHCNEQNVFLSLSYFFKCMTIIDNIVLSATDIENNIDNDNLSISKKTVNEIMKYINSHITETITVASIAQTFYLNPDYISRIFKKHTNTAISNYIAMQRINYARKLLSSGHSVTETVELAGYSSYAHFFRTFKRIVGITPKEFKDMTFKQ